MAFAYAECAGTRLATLMCVKNTCAVRDSARQSNTRALLLLGEDISNPAKTAPNA